MLIQILIVWLLFKYNVISCNQNPHPLPKQIAYHDFIVTAYCPCAICNEKWVGVTAQGLKLQDFLDKKIPICAVDPIAIKLNSKIQYNGVTYWCKDVGGKIKGHHIDILMPTHKDAIRFGRKTKQTIYILEKTK